MSERPCGDDAEQPDAPWHGTAGGYSNHKCRGRGCTDAWAVRQKDYRRRQVERDPHGTWRGGQWRVLPPDVPRPPLGRPRKYRDPA